MCWKVHSTFTYSFEIAIFLKGTVRAALLSSIFFCRLDGLTSTIKSGLTFFLYCKRWRRPFMCISFALGSLNRHSQSLQLKDTILPVSWNTMSNLLWVKVPMYNNNPWTLTFFISHFFNVVLPYGLDIFLDEHCGILVTRFIQVFSHGSRDISSRSSWYGISGAHWLRLLLIMIIEIIANCDSRGIRFRANKIDFWSCSLCKLIHLSNRSHGIWYSFRDIYTSCCWIGV